MDVSMYPCIILLRFVFLTSSSLLCQVWTSFTGAARRVASHGALETLLLHLLWKAMQCPIHKVQSQVLQRFS